MNVRTSALPPSGRGTNISKIRDSNIDNLRVWLFPRHRADSVQLSPPPPVVSRGVLTQAQSAGAGLAAAALAARDPASLVGRRAGG